MNEYLFYTPEGDSEPPRQDCTVENCQLLGRIHAKRMAEAKKKLLTENPWIVEAGFDPSEIRCVQILTEEQRSDIKKVLDYLWHDEERHYEEGGCGPGDNHIFNTLKRLKKAATK